MNRTAKSILKDFYYQYGVKAIEPCLDSENYRIAQSIANSTPIEKKIFELTDANGNGLGKYCRINDILSHDEITDYLAFKQIDILSQIKKCLVFFVTITVIGFLVGLFYLLLYWRII